MIDQDSLDKETLFSMIGDIMSGEGFAERLRTIQKEVSALDGLETAIQTTLDVAEGGKAFASA